MNQSTLTQEVLAGDYTLRGVSTAGVGTSIYVPELKVCFDTAQGLPHAFHAKTYLITHAHMDHAGGIPYILSQKSMTSQPCGTFYMPAVMVDPLTRIMNTWSEIEGYECPFHFQATQSDMDVPINKDHFFRIFPTHHRVPSNGYTIFKKKKKLNPAYMDLPKDKLLEAKDQETDFWIHQQIPVLSFTGDTTSDFLDGPSWVRESKVLILEVTYGGDKKTVANARQWGHIHLDEIVPRLETVTADHIVFIHRSSRYSLKEFRELVKKKVPHKHLQKIILFP